MLIHTHASNYQFLIATIDTIVFHRRGWLICNQSDRKEWNFERLSSDRKPLCPMSALFFSSLASISLKGTTTIKDQELHLIK